MLQFLFSGMQFGERLALCSFIWSVKFAYKRYRKHRKSELMHLQDLDIGLLASYMGVTQERSGVKRRFRAGTFPRLAN